MGYSPLLRGRVTGVARGINIPNVQPDTAGLASVNPIFTWVRLAQRVPVRVQIDHVPEGVRLVAGMTATVQIDPRPSSASEVSFSSRCPLRYSFGRPHIRADTKFRCDHPQACPVLPQDRVRRGKTEGAFPHPAAHTLRDNEFMTGRPRCIRHEVHFL